MIRDVKNHCERCLGCASKKNTTKAYRAHLCPIPVERCFDRVASDILGPLPLSTSGNKYIIVFTEYLSKWVETFPISDCAAKTTAKLFVEKIICRYCAPAKFLTDRGTNYVSDLVKEICSYFDIKKLNTSAYHPQTDGLTVVKGHSLGRNPNPVFQVVPASDIRRRTGRRRPG